MNKISKCIGGLLLGVLLVGGLFGSESARALDIGADNFAATTGGIGNTIDPCLNSGGAFGFVFCPAVEVFASVADYFLNTMSEGFNWGYLITTPSSGALPVVDVWSNLLPVANVLFATVFLVVIYSVATGQGLNNYSIKKVMPRLVLIAVAVNVSYYICAALIDISNIVSAGIYDLVYGGLSGGNVPISFTSLAKSVFDMKDSGASLVGTSSSIGALLILFGNMLAVLLGVGAIFIGAAARNVMLVVLLLSAPLAFVAALLPNTENIFRRWGNSFLQMLVIYPLFMFIWAVCRALQAVFLDTDATALELILSTLLSVAPAVAIIPLFQSTNGLTGKVSNIIQRGSAGLAPNITNNQTVNKKVNSQTIDQINQKKFTSNQAVKTNTKAGDSQTQNTFSNESNSSLSSRTTLAASEINTAVSNTTTTTAKPATSKSKRARSLSANLKSKVDISNVQSSGSLLQNSQRSSATSNTNINNSSTTQTNNTSGVSGSLLNRFRASQSSGNINRASVADVKDPKVDLSGEFDKLADVIKAKSQNQPLTRERAIAKAPTPTPRKQMFSDSSGGSSDKSQKAFDISTKSPTTNVFSGKGQQVSIENSGKTSQLVEQKILDSPAMVDGAPSIVSEESIVGQSVDESDAADVAGDDAETKTDQAAASAPSIVQDIISDDDRKNRFANQAGQKELAKMLTITNVKQFLPSDISYILGIGPLLSVDGQELAPISDISKEPEYTEAAQIVTDYINTLSDDEKKVSDVYKWQKQLGLL